MTPASRAAGSVHVSVLVFACDAALAALAVLAGRCSHRLRSGWAKRRRMKTREAVHRLAQDVIARYHFTISRGRSMGEARPIGRSAQHGLPCIAYDVMRSARYRDGESLPARVGSELARATSSAARWRNPRAAEGPRRSNVVMLETATLVENPVSALAAGTILRSSLRDPDRWRSLDRSRAAVVTSSVRPASAGLMIIGWFVRLGRSAFRVVGNLVATSGFA